MVVTVWMQKSTLDHGGDGLDAKEHGKKIVALPIWRLSVSSAGEVAAIA